MSLNIVEIIEQLVKLYAETEAIKLEAQASIAERGKDVLLAAAEEIRANSKHLIKSHNFR